LPYWVERALIGTAAHNVISLWYASLGAIIDLKINDDDKSRPDIRFERDARFPGVGKIALTEGEVYEIKPRSRVDRAKAEVQDYIVRLRAVDPDTFWRPGQLVPPFPEVWPGYLVHPLVANRTMRVEFMGDGAIVYSFDGDTTGDLLLLGFAVATAVGVASASSQAGFASLQLNIGLSIAY
jgi:hypothetical protein